MTYVLYFTPGACSLTPNILLREAGLPFELARVDLRKKKLENGEDFLVVNPKGYVPALRLPDGSVLTEIAVMVQYIADQKPELKLAPPTGGMERYRFQELLNFIATELHKASSPLYSPAATDEFKKQLKERLASRLQYLEGQLRDGYLTGSFSAADPYAFYFLRTWQRVQRESLDRWPGLADYYKRLSTRPSVTAALAAEGLEP